MKYCWPCSFPKLKKWLGMVAHIVLLLVRGARGAEEPESEVYLPTWGVQGHSVRPGL